MKIALTGATGFVGRNLAARLTARGDTVLGVGRQRLSLGQLRGIDAIVNLAGEPVAQRWTPAVKRRIRDSRVEGTRYLATLLAKAERGPKILVNASAVGFYGSRGDETLDESSPRGDGFLAEVADEWEDAAAQTESAGIRAVAVRIGIVLGRDGGALKKMLPPFRMGLGGKLGTRRSWMSWVHIDDVTGLFLHALDHENLSGPVNATAPEPVTNDEFAKELAAVLHRRAWLTVPEFALRLAFGELGTEMLASQRVKPAAALASGYQFQFPELRPALENLLTVTAN